MRHQVELLRVLHDPLGYYRPWAEHGKNLAAVQRSALNAWLGQRHRLPAYVAPPAAQQRLVERLLRGWSRLPATAYLLGCAKHRRRVLGSRHLLSLAPQAHAFMRLPFAESLQPLGPVLDNDALQAWGAAYLLHGLRAHLPDWLSARVRLWFAGLTVPALEASDKDNFDMACFWSAWGYAADVS